MDDLNNFYVNNRKRISIILNMKVKLVLTYLFQYDIMSKAKNPYHSEPWSIAVAYARNNQRIVQIKSKTMHIQSVLLSLKNIQSKTMNIQSVMLNFEIK